MPKSPMAREPVQSGWNHKALIFSWMGGDDASRLPRRRFNGFSLAKGIPADASGAYWSGPRANNRIFPGEISSYSPPPLKGYVRVKSFYLMIEKLIYKPI